MRAMVCKWGDSLALRIPHEIAQDAHMAEGTPVDLRIEDGRIVVERIEVESLDVLRGRVTQENRHGEQFAGAPVGREVDLVDFLRESPLAEAVADGEFGSDAKLLDRARDPGREEA